MLVVLMLRRWLFLALVWRASFAVAIGAAAEDLQLTLPPAIYAVAGVETGIYFDNAVHPNAAGYRQIATSLYAWLKWRESRPERPEK